MAYETYRFAKSCMVFCFWFVGFGTSTLDLFPVYLCSFGSFSGSQVFHRQHFEFFEFFSLTCFVTLNIHLTQKDHIRLALTYMTFFFFPSMILFPQMGTTIFYDFSVLVVSLAHCSFRYWPLKTTLHPANYPQGLNLIEGIRV